MPCASSSSIYRGVKKVKGADRWIASISVGGAQKSVGRFQDEIEAAKAYDRAAMQHHKAPMLNFRSDGSLNPDRKMRVAGVVVSQGKARSSRYRGVYWRPGMDVWTARIFHGGSRKHLGNFADEDDAARAVDAAIRLQRLDRPLNFPDKNDATVPMQSEEDNQAEDSDDDFTMDDEGSEWDDAEGEDTEDSEVEHMKAQAKDGDVDAGAQAEQQQQQQQLVTSSAFAPGDQPLNKRLRRSAVSASASRAPSHIKTSATAASAAAASAARSAPSVPVATTAQIFDVKVPAVDSVPIPTPRDTGTDSSTAIINIATDNDEDEQQLCRIISAPANKPTGSAVKLPSVQCDAADVGAAGTSSAGRSAETSLRQLRAVVLSARIDISTADKEKLSKACALLYQTNVREEVVDFAENAFNNPFSRVDPSSSTERRKIVEIFLETISATLV